MRIGAVTVVIAIGVTAGVAMSTPEGRPAASFAATSLGWVAPLLLAAVAYPLLLAVLDAALGRAAPTARGVTGMWLVEAVGLYSDLVLLLMILLPVALSLLLALVTCFFLAMTLAGLIWGYRWIVGRYQPALNRDLAIAVLVYLGAGSVLSTVALLWKRLDAWRGRYLDCAHGLRQRCLEWGWSRTRRD